MGSTAAARTAVADPVVRPRVRRGRQSRTQVRARRGILWIAGIGVLLAGVVFVSVAVLRLNLALDSANGHRTQLQSDVAALQAQLATQLGSPRIQSQAQAQLGVVQVDPSEVGYVDLSK